MTYFTHEVRGKRHGAWYRQLSQTELEIIGAGFMRRAEYAGFDALAVARSVLENSIAQQQDECVLAVTPGELPELSAPGGHCAGPALAAACVGPEGVHATAMTAAADSTDYPPRR